MPLPELSGLTKRALRTCHRRSSATQGLHAERYEQGHHGSTRTCRTASTNHRVLGHCVALRFSPQFRSCRASASVFPKCRNSNRHQPQISERCCHLSS